MFNPLEGPLGIDPILTQSEAYCYLSVIVGTMMTLQSEETQKEAFCKAFETQYSVNSYFIGDFLNGVQAIDDEHLRNKVVLKSAGIFAKNGFAHVAIPLMNNFGVKSEEVAIHAFQSMIDRGQSTDIVTSAQFYTHPDHIHLNSKELNQILFTSLRVAFHQMREGFREGFEVKNETHTINEENLYYNARALLQCFYNLSILVENPQQKRLLDGYLGGTLQVVIRSHPAIAEGKDPEEIAEKLYTELEGMTCMHRDEFKLSLIPKIKKLQNNM